MTPLDPADRLPQARTADRVRSSRLRVVLLGAGMIGTIHHRAIQLAGADLVGVLTGTPEGTRAAATAFTTTAMTDLGDLTHLQPDVVHVCTPNALHAVQVETALAAGAHVICEKPLAVDRASADHLAALAAEYGRIATVPFVYRFHPLVREIRARAQAGHFGTWQLLHGSYLQDWLISPESTSWRVSAAAGGPSRTFADIGSHWCDLVEFVTGERIATVTARMTTTVPSRPFPDGSGPRIPVDTEDAASVIFETTSGVLGSVIVSQVSAGRKNRLWFELDGSRGSAVFDQEQPETVWLGGMGGGVEQTDPSVHSADIILRRDPAVGSGDARRLSSLPPGHAQGYAQCFESFVADSYAAVQGDHRDGLPTFADGARSAAIVDAVVASARTGRTVEVGTATGEQY